MPASLLPARAAEPGALSIDASHTGEFLWPARLLLGSGDAKDGDGFLSPFFGSGQSNRFQPSVGCFWRPQTASPAPASASPQSGIQAVPTYYSRIGENQGFAVRPALDAAKESRLPGLENGPADAFRHMVWAAELTRRYGAATASDILDEHEKSGRHLPGWTQDAETWIATTTPLA
jgi:hypothetical protein